jgi:hypothetical protein
MNTTYQTTSVPITFTVTETPLWIGYSLNGQRNVTITGNTTLSGLAEGTYHLTVYVTDPVGNTGGSPEVFFNIQSQQELELPNVPTWFVAVTVIIGIVAATIFLVQNTRRKSRIPSKKM